MQKGFVPILIVIIVATLAVGGYFVYQKVKPKSNIVSSQVKDWKVYNHSNFSFNYPNSWYPKENSGYPGGNNVSFFLNGTDADFGYGDHKGKEVFSFEFSEDNRSLEELKKNYYKDATYLSIDGKPTLKTSFGLIIVKPTANTKLNIVTGIEQAKPYVNDILSSFKFSNSSDVTANWKTYVNNTLKYQISYPENSQYQKNFPGRSQLTEYDSDSTQPSLMGSTNIDLVLENNDEIPSVSSVWISVWKNLGIKVVDIASRDEWCKKLQPELQGQQSCHYKSEIQIEETELNNFQAFKANGGRDNSLETEYYVPYRDYIYQISISRPLQDLDNPLPGKVLSTFKFTQ